MPPFRSTPIIGLLIAGLLLVYGFALVFVNRAGREIRIEQLSTAPDAGAVSDRLTVMSWNIGYGGLGAESDFIADGGDRFLPPSRRVVEKNIAGIAGVLSAAREDVVLVQEAAKPGPMTRGADTLGAVNASLDGRDNVFTADVNTRWAPPFLSLHHGLFSSIGAAGAVREIHPLPREPGHLMGLAKRLYHLQVTRLPFDSGEWTLINVHLSAFDDGADVRRAQLREALAFAEREFAQGRFVIIGGDWNLELAQPGRPHNTGDEDLFWIHTFPRDMLGEGWRIAADAGTPSVRTNERPYRSGENFTTVIDGFVVSPNVDIESLATIDLDFRFADHQPVVGAFRARQ